MRFLLTVLLLLALLTACENPLSNSNEKLDKLYSAIESGDEKAIEDLLTKKIINKKLEDKEYPFLYAASLGQEQMVLDMLEYKPDLKAEDHVGNNLLLVAIENNLEEVTTKLIEKDEININQQNDYGYTAILFAAEKGNFSIVKLLLGKNADPTIPNEEGYLPIHSAAVSNNLDILHALIKQSEINAQDKSGNTPLNYAVSQLNYDTCQLLLENGANVNLANNEGYTPLAKAVIFEDESIIKLLLNHGADRNSEVNGKKIVDLTDNQMIVDLIKKGE